MGRRVDTASGAAKLMIPILVVIPAHNEAATIGDTVAALTGLLSPNDKLLVIDDGSTDETAAIAQQAGAEVLRRCAAEFTGRKGTVLCWALEKTPVRENEVVVVLDADAQVDQKFLTSIRARFAASAQAIQCQIMPVSEASSPVAALAGCSTKMEQAVDDRFRLWLGWPVRLRGTGMAFRREVLTRFAARLKTMVEDVELSLLLTEAGIHIVFAPEAIVHDPLPITFEAASRQRARWMAGQADVWRKYWRTILRLLVQGPGAWSLVGSVLVKPRVVWIALRALMLLPLLLWPAGWIPAGVIALSLLADLAYMCAAVIFFGDVQAFLKGVPLYAGVWLQSTLLALNGTPGWLRARP